MPHVPKTHKDNQESICGICLSKKQKLLRNITETTLEQIQKLKVFEDYNKTKDECGRQTFNITRRRGGHLKPKPRQLPGHIMLYVS